MFSRFSRLSHFAPAVFIAISLHAPCAAAADDELAALLLERGLINRISSVSLAVADRAADLVINAMGFVGVPYKRGGNSVETGFDCSGFVRAMFEQTMGLLLPRKAATARHRTPRA